MQPVDIAPHQLTAVEKMHNGCVLVGGVGVGKSRAAIAYFITKVCCGTVGDPDSLKVPKDLLIITTAKKRDALDWEEEALRFGLYKERDLSLAGIQVTVDSWNNLAKYKDVKDVFVVFDEQRLVGSGSWVKSFLKIAQHNQWILLSATPGDTWLDYIPIFIANGWYKNRSQFKQEHVIYKTFRKFPVVDRYVGTGKLVRLRNRVLVEMPYEKHTVRHSNAIIVDYDEKLLKRVVTDRWHVYENRPLRDASELFSVMRKVVNSDLARLETVKSLLIRHPKLIVFYNFDYELEILRTLDPTSSMTTSKRLKKRQSSPALSSVATATTPSLESGSVLTLSRNEGHWTTDKGKGELWIPNQTSTEQQEKISMRLSSGQSMTTNGSGSKSSSSNTLTLERPGTKASSAIKSATASTTPATSKSFEIGEWNGHKHQEIPKTDSWVYLVQYTAGSEGWNCIETDAICFYSQTYSYRSWHQAYGRIDRLNTPFVDLYYYNLLSRAAIDLAIKKALTTKRNFNESSFRLNF